MAKLPARLGDQVNNSTHGNGSITQGNSSVTFQGQPIACAGDKAIFADGTEGAIVEGNACVLINGRRVALVGDKTENDGILQQGAESIQIDEGEPFVFIGNNVEIGSNVIFSNKSIQFYDLFFVLYNEVTGKPLSYTSYRINTPQGTIEGVSDEQGHTTLVSSEKADEVTIEILDELDFGSGADECCSDSFFSIIDC